MRACVRACVRGCVRACVRACDLCNRYGRDCQFIQFDKLNFLVTPGDAHYQIDKHGGTNLCLTRQRVAIILYICI